MATPHRPLRRTRVWITGLLLLILFGCSSPDPTGSDDDAAAEQSAASERPRQYRAEWLIDAEVVKADGGGFPFVYREVVDDVAGAYLVQSPEHLAVQFPDEVVFCAAILRGDPFCASAPRAEGTPSVLAYPLQLLREWGPRPLYDLASHREFELAVAREADAWQRRTGVVGGDIAVDCFAVVGETSAADEGFEICFTDDDLHLVASVDLQSDLVFEIDLIGYERTVEDADFVTGLEDVIEARPPLQEQLLTLYPEVPAPRPTPTPDIDE